MLFLDYIYLSPSNWDQSNWLATFSMWFKGTFWAVTGDAGSLIHDMYIYVLLLHFRIFFVYVWFLKQLKYIYLKFFGKSRNNIYVCFILESFLFYVWFLKQLRDICFKFFEKSRNNVYDCFILEWFLFTFGFWNNSNIYVWSSLKKQEIMYMSASF